MDFRHLIVTCLFSMLRLSFETQKIKENYAIFLYKRTSPVCLSLLMGFCGWELVTEGSTLMTLQRISCFVIMGPAA